MKQSITAFVVSAALMSGVAQSASAPDYSAVQKDMDILSNILQTASKPADQSSRRWRHHDLNIESIYLANQGMVFTIDLPGAHWGARIAAPLAPLPPLPPKFSYHMDGEEHEVHMPAPEELEAAVADAMESVAETMHEFGFEFQHNEKTRSEMSEVRDALHKAARDYRDWQRKFAEANRNKSTSDAEKQKLRESMEKSKQAFDLSRKNYHAKAEKLRAESAKKWQEQIQQMESTLLDALCAYSSSTRRLGNNENVSLILQNAGVGEDKDRVWVISKPLLDQCVGKIQESGFLRKSALQYES